MIVYLTRLFITVLFIMASLCVFKECLDLRKIFRGFTHIHNKEVMKRLKANMNGVEFKNEYHSYL